MSGVRRRTKYRKSTMRSVTDEFPEPDENEYIVMALGSRGSNIFEVRMSFFTFALSRNGKTNRETQTDSSTGRFRRIGNITYKISKTCVGQTRYVFDCIG